MMLGELRLAVSMASCASVNWLFALSAVRGASASKKFREAYAHTPLSTAEEIPWKCRRLVIGKWGPRQSAGHG